MDRKRLVVLFLNGNDCGCLSGQGLSASSECVEQLGFELHLQLGVSMLQLQAVGL